MAPFFLVPKIGILHRNRKIVSLKTGQNQHLHPMKVCCKWVCLLVSSVDFKSFCAFLAVLHRNSSTVFLHLLTVSLGRFFMPHRRLQDLVLGGSHLPVLFHFSVSHETLVSLKNPVKIDVSTYESVQQVGTPGSISAWNGFTKKAVPGPPNPCTVLDGFSSRVHMHTTLFPRLVGSNFSSKSKRIENASGLQVR